MKDTGRNIISIGQKKYDGAHPCVSSRFLIPGQFVAIGIGDSFSSTHDDVEKVSQHR